MGKRFYFSHDYGARNDPKLLKVLIKHGQAGKGVYWDLIEMMFEENGYLVLNEVPTYAFALRVDEALVWSMINDFGLFQQDESRFWSNSVLNRLSERDEKSEKAKRSAEQRWKHPKINANALQLNNDGNAIKESKGKENKGKEKKRKSDGASAPAPDSELLSVDPPAPPADGQGGRKRMPFSQPTLHDVLGYMATYRPGMPDAARTHEADKFVNHYTANGWKVGRNSMKDWQAAARNWLNNSYADASPALNHSTQRKIIV